MAFLLLLRLRETARTSASVAWSVELPRKGGLSGDGERTPVGMVSSEMACAGGILSVTSS